MSNRRVLVKSQRLALILTILMIGLPWSTSINSELDFSIEESEVSKQYVWGASGSNDTGWIDFDATGADSVNGTYAYSDYLLEIAPGSQISNLTFEIAVNGSAGYWATEPQLNLLNTQTPILDWRGYGDFGRQNSISENPPTVIDGTLEAQLRPNSISDVSWEIPAGVTISDLVMEVLRPADAKVSLSSIEVTIYDSAVNPIDGRLYILLDDDLLHIDATTVKPIIDIEYDIFGRSLAIDSISGSLLIGTANGTIKSRSLFDSSIQSDLLNSSLPDYQISSIAVDQNGIVWATSEVFDTNGIPTDTSCMLSYLVPTSSPSWNEYQFCQDSSEFSSDLLVYHQNGQSTNGVIYLSTHNDGVHVIEYTHNGNSFSINSDNVWNTQNFLVSNQITDLEIVGDNLLIGTSDSGINRYNFPSDSWMTTWTMNNWLASNEIHGLAVSDGWLHILAGNSLHAYDTNTLVFRTTKTLSDLGLTGNSESIFPWSAHGNRGLNQDSVLINDGSGTLARQQGLTQISSITLLSGPSIESMQVVSRIDDGEAGETWIAGGSIIDRFDERTKTWRSPIDISDYVNNPGEITAFEQDGNDKVWIGTTNAGILRLHNNEADATSSWYIGTVQGLSSPTASSISYDSSTGYLAIGHSNAGVSVIDTNSMTLVDVITTSDGLDTDFVIDLVCRYGTAYIATPNKGVMRIELNSSTIIGSWQSLGADNLEATPIAVDDDIVYIGLFDFGILLIDRITGDILNHWTQETNTLPDNDVYDLELDNQGGLLVGADGAFSRYDGSTWTTLTTNGPWWQNPSDFYDVTSDGDGLYAGTNQGACKWNWQFQFQDCVSTNEGLESRFVYTIEMLAPDRAYTGGNSGAGIVNMDNFSVIETWTAGDDTQRARTVKIHDILYIGFENTGIARYNITSQQWLTAWDGSQGYIDDDDVTALVPGISPGTIWAGGDFGLTLIDVVNDLVLIEWNRGANPGGPTLSNNVPADIEIYGDILHYSEQRINQGSQRDNIFRINLSTNSSLSTLDAGNQAGFSGSTYGIGTVGDQLWIGVASTSWWQDDSEGTIVRWNMTSQSWEDNLPTIGNVLRVNARFLGDCFPLNITSCELWVSYGDNVLRRFNADSMNLLNEWTDIDGPIRGMEEYDGEYLFASMNGILRWNPVNSSWLDSWTPGDGLPSDSEDEFYSMEVINSDLWLGSLGTGGWNPGTQILRKDGSTGNWTSWDLDSGDIPGGYPADIKLCDDIIHVAIGRRSFWGNQGGVARFDLVDHDSDGISGEWITAATQSNGLSDPDARALACDDANNILYVGFDTDGVGIDRYNYNSNSYLSTLTSNDGIGDDRVFPGGMLHDNNVLFVAHQVDQNGGLSRIVTSGTATSNGQLLDPGMDGCSIDRAPSNTGQRVYAIGRSGQTTGLNRVDRLDNTGLIVSGFDELAGLASGRILEIISNDTHVWAVSAMSSGDYFGSSILQGQILANGSVRWEFGYNFQDDIVNEIKLDGEKLWVATAGRGLKYIDLQQRRIFSTASALHSQMDGMVIENDGTMYVGLMGRSGSAAGFQTFDTGAINWGHGSLLAGLPSNTVRDFLEYGDHILIATHGGIGMWNTTRDDWDDPITTIDGLPSSIIEHLSSISSPIQGNGTILAGGVAGLTVLHQSNLSIIKTLDINDGLMGNSVSGITYAAPTSRVIQNPDGSNSTIYHDAAIFISHNGQGVSRPGAVAWDLATDSLNGTYNIDMIPSNDVRAIAADDWGVHIATDTTPLVHWNGSKMQIETGVGQNSLQAWPPFEILSDGTHLVVLSDGGLDVLDVDGLHNVISSKEEMNIQTGYLDNSGLYILSNDGLHVFDSVISLIEDARVQQRRSSPLTLLYEGRSWDVTETTHPGMSTVLVQPDNPIEIDNVSVTTAPGRVPLHTGSMTMIAPQAGSWLWARSTSLNYSGVWDMAATNGGIQQAFQSAIDAIGPGSDSAILHLQMQSPTDGSIQVRITYDWERLEVPTILNSLEDRPNDGGGVLTASWLPADDAAWNAYRLYVWDSTDNPLWEPEREDLSSMSTYIRSNFWSQTETTIDRADYAGQVVSLQDDRMYRAAISIEYADGTLGVPITYPLNATPTDEIPAPPEWLVVEPIEGGTPGTVSAEWASCKELDPDKTIIWAVQQEINNAIGLTNGFDFQWSTGNSTILQLQGGVPYWFAAVCVDDAGQMDVENATIVGPIVTAGGLNDGIPPSPVTGTEAVDVPDDEGGRLNVSWNKNSEEDCTYYSIFILPASGFQPPSIVEGWPISAYTNDCETTSLIIDSIGNNSLFDGITYWIGVVAFDDWGNADLDNVLVVEATPQSNINGTGIAPDRVLGIDAWDHPSDDGTAIDIRWNRSSAEDFDFYTVWVSEYPLTNVTEIWSLCQESPTSCGLVTIDQRQFGANFQLELMITKAIYGNSIDSLKVENIQPMIPLYVTVTIHDISGNAHLNQLREHMVLVTPIDNRGDVSPPERLLSPILSDRPNDVGDGMFVDFKPSEASDIAEYRIYAVIDTPVLLDRIEDLSPALIINREEQLPVLLTEFSNHGTDESQPLVPNRRIYVAVVAVDSSGNAWTNNLASSWIELTDEQSSDPCPECPDVSGIRANWDAAGMLIEITWDNAEDPFYSTYYAFVSNNSFDDTRNATLVKSGMRDTILILSEFEDNALIREETYWIEIVTYNGDVHTFHADPIEIPPWSEDSFGTNPGGEPSSSESWYEKIISGELNMMVALISVIMLLFSAILFIKPKQDSTPAPWEMGALEVEMEEQQEREAAGLSDDEDFGIDELEIDRGLVASARNGSDSKSTGDDFYVATAATAGSEIEEELNETSSPDAQVIDELLGDSEEELSIDDLGDLVDSLDNEDIDTSFLDEML